MPLNSKKKIYNIFGGNTYNNSLANPSGTATKFYRALYILDTIKTGFLHVFIKADTKTSKSSSFQKLKRL